MVYDKRSAERPVGSLQVQDCKESGITRSDAEIKATCCWVNSQSIKFSRLGFLFCLFGVMQDSERDKIGIQILTLI